MMKTNGTNLWARRVGTLVLALCLALLLPSFAPSAGAAFSDEAMDKLVNWGVVSGYPNGEIYPGKSLTRAEFVAMVNRAYGYSGVGETPFYDVPETAWYADDIGIAYNAGYFTGVSPHMAYPNSTLTREQATVLLARNMRLEPVPGEVIEFADGRELQSWSRGYIRAAAQAGLINGYGDGSFRPQNNITRGEMAVLLQRALGTLINTPGVHTVSDVYGNVTISSPNTTLRDSTIAGNLYVTGGLGLGDVTLENVRVLGDIIVAGGGESGGSGESVVLRNVEADSLVVDSIADQYVSLRAEGNTLINETVLRSDSYVLDRTRPGEGLLTIALESPDPTAEFTLSGNLETVVNRTPGSTLTVAMGTVDALTVDEAAKNAALKLDENSTVKTLNLDTATAVTGPGDVDTLNVNAAGSTIEMLPDQIAIRPGLTADVAGATMNTQQGQESSADPRLLAGYPKLKNVAPTTATAVFSANKAGTVYWAVSTTTDGSIGEDELISPTEGNTKLLQSGSTAITASNKEVTASLKDLAADGSYYLSAVMVDARGRHSPVKVASFKTPDNTVPAFNSGYPKVTQNDFYVVKGDDGKDVSRFHVQVSSMTNKSCQLYYALYPAGSSAPTGQQFRTGALGKPIQSGIEDVTKNEISFLDFRNLDELTSYDLYLWLTDADGARSSAVQKLTFKTVDGTPPEFQYETPEVSGNPTATSIPVKVNVSEASTVYWAAVKHGVSYIGADAAGTTLQSVIDALGEKETSALQRKIESGSGSLRSGSVRATADRDVSISITGLAAETSYDLFFVAKDSAGNYSAVKVLEDRHTLDTSSPTVEQNFTRVDERGNPYADTNIELVFSEDVQLYSTSGVPELQGKSLTSIASDPELLEKFLKASVSLYNNSGDDPTVPLPTRSDAGGGDWVIDYRKATVKLNPDTKQVTLTLSTANEALNLKSGSTYHFVFDNLQDLATTPNRMLNMPVSLENFRTVAAQVTLRRDVSAATLDGAALAEDGENAIDMAFSMRPNSVNVEDNVLWDLLLWSDTTVDFALYYRERGSSDSAWKPVPRTGTANSAVTVRAGSGDYIAKSLFTHFKADYEDLPQQINKLDSSKTYEFAIHFTKVGDVTEDEGGRESGWNQQINFHVTVVTADTAQAMRNLTNSTGGVTAATYARSQQNEGVLEINNTDTNSDYFALFKEFSDSNEPKFVSGYPRFTMQDSSVEIRVQTDRPGRLYYVIAPFSEPRTENDVTTEVYVEPMITTPVKDGSISGKYETTATSEKLIAYFYPSPDGSEEAIPDTGVSSASDTTDKEFRLTRPYPSQIYEPNEMEGAQSGSIPVTGGSVQRINLTGLTSSTSYFAYFVLQSDGQPNYSKQVILYQFRTEAISRPKLYLVNNGTSTVNVRSRNMDATADYAIFLMTGLPERLSEPFSKAVDSKYTAVVSALGGDYMVDGYTVYMAMTNQDSTGGSLYDKYASETHKDDVRKLVTGQTFSNGRINGSTRVSLAQDVTDIVDCETKYGIKADNNQYLFVASARSRSADESVSANSYGFSAYQPVYIVDDSVPVITRITGSHIEVDASSPTEPAKISGTISLTFDKALYLYNTATDRPALVGGTDGHPDEFREGGKVDSDPIQPTSISTSPANTTVTLTLKDVKDGTSFEANHKLASYYSTPVTFLSLTFSYDRNNNKVIVTVDPADPWYPAGSVALNASVKTPDTERIDLNPSTLDMQVGDESPVSVNFTPYGATGRLIWSYTSGDSGAVTLTTSSDTTSATIHANRAGTVTYTVSVAGSSSIQSKELTITVNPSIYISPRSLTLKPGGTASLSISVDAGTTITGAEWGSNNPTTAYVSTSMLGGGGGDVQAVAEGSATITATVTYTVGSDTIPKSIILRCPVTVTN